MKNFYKGILIIGILAFFASCNQETAEGEGIEYIQEEIVDNKMESDSVLRHVVFFSFKEGTSEAEIKTVVDAFRDLQNKIPGIESFEWGVNSSPEGINKGLTHAFTLTFLSNEARDAYLPHPDHKAFGAILGPFLEDVMVVDYWTKK